MKYKIKFVHPIYTGGGIYVFVGSLEGSIIENESPTLFFMASDETCSVIVMDSSPYIVNADGCGVNEDIFFQEWIDKHLVEEMTDKDAFEFMKKMYLWIIRHQPHDAITNYQVDDMEYALEHMGYIHEDGFWYEDE